MPKLGLRYFDKVFVFEIDASSAKLGVVLMQESKTFTYFNHVLMEKARLKLVYE